jgi:hypothetical protein
MKHLKTTRLAVLTLAMAGLSAGAVVQAQQGASEDALRELGIMRNIFAAAMNDNGQGKGYRRFNMGPPEALYLAGQGMVFTFHLNGSGGVVFNGNQIVVPPMPAAPVYIDGDFDYDFDFDFDFDYDFGDGGDYTAIREQQREIQEQLRTMNEEVRDGQQELRQMQREIRELQREERNDDVDNADKISDVEARMEALITEMQAHATSMQELQQKYQTEQQATFEAARTEQTATIFSTLCDYGNTLRSLSSGEHVNIVLRNYADNQTQVTVFDYADLANCSSADTLRQAGTTYVQDSRGF